ncbi:hypothetical protein N7457_005409 [Penicillium paradoxum]|uniref:uncharacterized protein n=1 Tax=Penicillium paradoxum TaxID=176176 RepID=UPI00254762F1|nr:uncharacterized protein N7457_005409 [Penicillium paradoxum]KAJ5780249.1 hypothetical protein N7457_005409 [Penicillium paradoxum]
MFRFSSSLIVGLLAASLPCSRALEVDCDGSFRITSEDMAEALRHVCPEVGGSLVIGPFTDNNTIHHLNLDGIVSIGESLMEDRYAREGYPPYTVSSSTLNKAGGVSFGTWGLDGLMSLSLPNLTYVEDRFAIGEYNTKLTYLDITNLESVSTLSLTLPNVTTFRHKELRNVKTMYLTSMNVDTLDSLSGRPLNLTSATFMGDFPNIDFIPIGFKAVDDLRVFTNLSVTLGGPSTTDMKIGSFTLGGNTDIKYSDDLQSLEVDSLELTLEASIEHLDIRFDNLRSLKVSEYVSSSALKDITLPPKAVNWTGGFDLNIGAATALNLTSMYRDNEQGKRVQTWYWPTNISSIYIGPANVGNPFLQSDTFVAQQKAPLDSTPPPSVLKTFTVVPTANTTNFTCVPFLELMDMGRLPNNRAWDFCQNSTDVNGAISLHMPSLPIFVGAVFGATMWML